MPFPLLDSNSTLVLCFGDSDFRDQPQVLAELRAAYPNSHLIGCSSAGEIFQDKVHDSILAVAVAKFDHTRLRSASTRVSSQEDSFEAGRNLAQQLTAADLAGVFVVSDGLNVNGTELSRGLGAVLSPSVSVSGGLAGDGDRFESTWVLGDGLPCSHTLSAVGFYGNDVVLRHGSQGGWDLFGVERTITRSRGAVLYELDGQPALDLYRDYLGERAAGLPATGLLFPLGIRPTSGEHHVVRTILGINEEDRSLTFAGDVPEGWSAQLMKANFDRLVEGAYSAADGIESTPVDVGATLCIAISCVGRRFVLGERTDEELEATLESLPMGTEQVGFYSYGELSPQRGVPGCELHNQTMTLTTLAERVPCPSIVS